MTFCCNDVIEKHKDIPYESNDGKIIYKDIFVCKKHKRVFVIKKDKR